MPRQTVRQLLQHGFFSPEPTVVAIKDHKTTVFTTLFQSESEACSEPAKKAMFEAYSKEITKYEKEMCGHIETQLGLW
jgi:hypothetical protein